MNALLALLDAALRLATAVAWIGITILAGTGCYVAGCIAFAACRITRAIRRRAVRIAARRRLQARRLARTTAHYGIGWATDTAATAAFHARIQGALDLEACREIWASGTANRKNAREEDPR